jgi:trimeric autotransporter adhesin
LGINAGSNLTTGSWNIDIGNLGVAGESGTIRIGSGNHARTFIAGISGVTTDVPDAIPVLIDSAGQLGTMSLRVGSNTRSNRWTVPAKLSLRLSR